MPLLSRTREQLRVSRKSWGWGAPFTPALGEVVEKPRAGSASVQPFPELGLLSDSCLGCHGTSCTCH